MEGMRFRWDLAEDSGAATSMRGLEPLVARVLCSRGISDEDARGFLEARIQDLESPTLMPGAVRAARVLLDALDGGRRVVVYGDYDVDGVSSTAILVRTMRLLRPGASVGWYVPHRLDEGYGLHVGALRQLRDDGADLVVSVDCGISAIEEARAAREMGLELIVTDHHNPCEDGRLPDAATVVHPRIAHEDGSAAICFPEPAGAGVAFKVAWQLCVMACGSERVGTVLQDHLLQMMALASLGTIADVVPLTGENRVLVKHGLRVLKHCEIVGVRALIEASGLGGDEISEEKVGFVLAPRINACGRMGHAQEAVELLMTEDADRAMSIAVALTKLNDERRATERRILAEALSMAQEEGLDDASVKAVVLAHESWHPGVIGIVCSRIVDRWHKPVILLQRGQEEYAGSCRSIDGFSMSSALAACDGYLLSHGGHDMAAGLRLVPSEYGAFREAFLELADGQLEESDLQGRLRIDCEGELGELTLAAVEQFAQLSPYGRGNSKPVVLVRDVRITREAMVMGKGNKHLALQAAGADGRGSMRLVGWNWGEHASAFAAGIRVDIAMEPSLNTWRGKRSVEGVIRDVRVREPAGSAVRATATSSIPS